MELSSIFAGVLLVYLAAVVSPGPNFAVVSRLSLTSSRAAGMAATTGIALASASYALITMIGVSALMHSAAWLNELVRLLGGTFLVYLGVAAWLHGSGTSGSTPAPATTAHLFTSLRTGLLVGFSNPKAIAFFGGLYAVLIPPEAPLWAKGTILLASFILEFGWYATVAILLSSPQAQALYGRFAGWIERGFGVLLVAIGVHFLIGLL